MGKNTDISWTDSTWNVARGCTKVSDGCKFCYMMRDGDRFGYDGKVVTKTKTVFNFPLKYKETKSMAWNGRPLIFTSSLTDVFHKDIDSFRHEIWDIIRKCPHLIFQILTKRPERIKKHLPTDWGEGWDNVWIGTSAENQEVLNERMEYMFEIKAKVKFLSIEPILSPINLGIPKFSIGEDLYIRLKDDIDWIIIGGESGNNSGEWKARPAQLKWFEDIVVQCATNDIPVFVKQLGTCLAKELEEITNRHGSDINEFPNILKIREFPKNRR